MAVTLESLGDMEIEIGNQRIHMVQPSFKYDAIADQVIFWMFGTPVSHLTEPANEVASILFDMDTGRAVGVQLDNFATHALHKFPHLEPLARFLGVVQRESHDLFVEQTVMMEQEVSDAELPHIKHLILTIVDQTGGIVDGALPDLIVG